MLQNSSPQYIWAVNVIIILLWHSLVWVFCLYAGASFFDPSKPIYQIRSWETANSFYVKKLKIKKWKDKLPQYVAKDGFSKKQLGNISELSTDYIKRFIVETCRGEWDHLMCCMYGIVSFIINPPAYAAMFSGIVIACNLPFIAIQRYNRIRLLRVYKKRRTKSTEQ